MCTVSTAANASQFLVTMNRDERRLRPEGPFFCGSDLSFPTDLPSGGTWCGVNRHGIILCLLNRYDAPICTDEAVVSRGHIIPEALKLSSVQGVSEFMSNLPHRQYNGFQLLILSADEAIAHHWDGTKHTIERLLFPGDVFASSSSLRSTTIPRQRAERFRRWRRNNNEPLQSGVIPEIHLGEKNIAPAESIFMVRRDTHTKSICQLMVSDQKVALHYWPSQLGWKKTARKSWSVAR